MDIHQTMGVYAYTSIINILLKGNNMKNNLCNIDQLKARLMKLGECKILEDCTSSEEYKTERLVFNRKFTFRPTAIIFVTNTEQVQEIVKCANELHVHLTVRSGGHDHEGECSATDSWLLDFSKMNAIISSKGGTVLGECEKIESGSEDLRVMIEPGARFEKIKKAMDSHNLGIPHGTCQTVGIAGYTMGGGWGPWTRKYGMACEHLVAATIVLGDGTKVELSDQDAPDSNKGQLLWALRGGGGLSYGIVTQFVFKPFVLPKLSFNFSINALKFFPNTNTLDVLKIWEKAIEPEHNPHLIGTNLKIVAKKAAVIDPCAQLECIMNGYFGGTLLELGEMICDWYNICQPEKPISTDTLLAWIKDKANQGITVYAQTFPQENGLEAGISHVKWPFHSWDRAKISKSGILEINLDPDCPAPHKITSRLANPEWNDSSRKALICSLQSPLLPSHDEGNNNSDIDFGFDTFITLGAITGKYYAQYDDKNTLGSAFPYKKQLFTIQYQAWWNQPARDDDGYCDETAGAEQKLKNREFSNRVEDWIEKCRDYFIDHTDGAFISFKDASVPTETYFSQNYQDLINIKLKYSKDKNFLFKTRKTIL